VTEAADDSLEILMTKSDVLPARHTMVFNARQTGNLLDVDFNISDTRASGILYFLWPCVFVRHGIKIGL
jgi:hypothetical protein